MKVELKNKLQRIEKPQTAKDYDNSEKIARETNQEVEKLNGETERKKIDVIDSFPAAKIKPPFK